MSYSVDFPRDVQQAMDRSAALLMQCADFANPPHIESVRAAARQKFEDALVAPIRTRNAMHSSWFVLPNDLWTTVWLLLPITDRLATSQVCHVWREVALATPTLWTQINVSSHFEPADGADYWTCLHCDSVEPPRKLSSPLASTRALLDRSAGLPVCVRVSNYDDPPHPEYSRHLGTILDDRGARVEELYISGVNSLFAVSLLASLRTLPALRALTIRIEELHRGVSVAVFDHAHTLDSLQSLDLSPGLSWGLPVQLPRLRSLSLAIYDPQELLGALRDCPSLHSLRITPRFAPDIAWDAALRAQLRVVPEVCVDGMQDVYARWFLQIYTDAPGTRVRLVFAFRAPSPGALSVLRAFAAPVHAACTLRGARFVLEFSDASRALEVKWPSARGMPIFPPVPLTSLKMAVAAWPALVARLSGTAAAGVQRVTLRLDSAGDVLRILNNPTSNLPGFSTLTELTLYGDQPSISLRVSSIKALCEKLRHPPRLILLRLSRVQVQGDVQELGQIAERVLR